MRAEVSLLQVVIQLVLVAMTASVLVWVEAIRTDDIIDQRFNVQAMGLFQEVQDNGENSLIWFMPKKKELFTFSVSPGKSEVTKDALTVHYPVHLRAGHTAAESGDLALTEEGKHILAFVKGGNILSVEAASLAYHTKELLQHDCPPIEKTFTGLTLDPGDFPEAALALARNAPVPVRTTTSLLNPTGESEETRMKRVDEESLVIVTTHSTDDAARVYFNINQLDIVPVACRVLNSLNGKQLHLLPVNTQWVDMPFLDVTNTIIVEMPQNDGVAIAKSLEGVVKREP